MSKHTPGPWIADNFCMQDDNAVRVGTTDGTKSYYHRTMTICECWIKESGDDENDAPHVIQAEANARLIAAAPDLLQALESVLAFEDPDSIEDQQTDIRLRQARAEAWERAKAAIRKATGGQS